MIGGKAKGFGKHFLVNAARGHGFQMSACEFRLGTGICFVAQGYACQQSHYHKSSKPHDDRLLMEIADILCSNCRGISASVERKLAGTLAAALLACMELPGLVWSHTGVIQVGSR